MAPETVRLPFSDATVTVVALAALRGTGPAFSASSARSRGHRARTQAAVADGGRPEPGPPDVEGRTVGHCKAGKHRSSGTVYAILRASGHAPAEAWRLIKAARPKVRPSYVNDVDQYPS